MKDSFKKKLLHINCINFQKVTQFLHQIKFKEIVLKDPN